MIPIGKKHEFWNHMIARAWEEDLFPSGMSRRKLLAIKQRLFQDTDKARVFWTDVILQHAGLAYTPEQLKAKDPAAYDHCFGNFWSRIALGS